MWIKKDDYGKYLIPLANYYKCDDKSFLDKFSIYNNISLRYIIKKSCYFFKTNIIYNKLYNEYINNSNYNIAQVQQLKDVVSYYRKEEWSLAYNSFYNFFMKYAKKFLIITQMIII